MHMKLTKAEQMQNKQPAQALCHSTETFARVDKHSQSEPVAVQSSASGHSPGELHVMLSVHMFQHTVSSS